MAKTNNGQKKSTKTSTKKTTAKSTKKVATAKKSANTKSVKTPVVKKEVAKPNVEEVKVEVVKPEIKKVNTRKATKEGFVSRTKNTIQRNWKERKEFVVACIIIAILALIIVLLAICKRIPKTKNGDDMAFIDASDETGKITFVLFSKPPSFKCAQFNFFI